MQWRCPACAEQIRHNELELEPNVGVLYRCHVCRLELEFNPRTQRLAVPPIDLDDGPTPARGIPDPFTRSTTTKKPDRK